MLKSKETLKKADAIYEKMGNTTQMDKFIEEFYEMLLALVRFRKDSTADRRREALEEIADFELMYIQIRRNVQENERYIFLDTMGRFDNIMSMEGVRPLWVGMRDKQEVENLAAQKADRTLKRIKSGYYKREAQ